MSNLSFLRSSYSLDNVVCSYYALGCLPKSKTRRLTFRPQIPQRYALDFERPHSHPAIKTNLLLSQRTPDLFKISSSITTRLLVVNPNMRHTYGDLGNFSIGDYEQLCLAAFYTEHIACIIVIPDENIPNRVLVPTCPAVVAGGSGINQSITTIITPLYHSRTLRKKTRSSDLRADFLRDELRVVKLPAVTLRRVPTVETLVQTRGSHGTATSGIQARVAYQLTKLNGATAKILRRSHGLGPR